MLHVCTCIFYILFIIIQSALSFSLFDVCFTKVWMISIMHFHYTCINKDCINIFMTMGEDYDDDDERFLRVCVLKPDKSLFLIIISECSSTSCCFTGCGSTAGCDRDQIRWHICQDNLCRWKLQLNFLLITQTHGCLKNSDPWKT